MKKVQLSDIMLVTSLSLRLHPLHGYHCWSYSGNGVGSGGRVDCDSCHGNMHKEEEEKVSTVL